MDGAFIDGDRNGFVNPVVGSCPAAKQKAWAAGLNQSVYELALRLGPNRTLITNYPTHEAMALCQGGMIERGAAMRDIYSWRNMRCGLTQRTCVLDYHVDHGTDTPQAFASTLAQFLIGVYEGAYLGLGIGWSGEGAGACEAWLRAYPEYKRPLGEPLGAYALTNGSYGDIYTRKFASGTKVYVGQHLPPVRGNFGYCVFWSDGTTTGNATQCDDSF